MSYTNDAITHKSCWRTTRIHKTKGGIEV